MVFARETTATQDWGAGLQRFFMVLFGVIGVLCVGVTMAGCFFFTLSLVQGWQGAVIATLISVAVDVLKVGLTLVIYSFAHREPTLTMLAKGLFAACLVWSALCSIGWSFMLAGNAYQPQTLDEAGNAAASGAALFLLMVMAQAASVLGPPLAVAGMRHAKDLPDEEQPAPKPTEMDFGQIEAAGDGISEWMREVVGMDRGGKVYLRHAYDSYVAFAKLNGHNVVAEAKLAGALRGHVRALTGQDAGRDRGTFFPGITLAGQERQEFLRIAN